jgi:hypothetical protein
MPSHSIDLRQLRRNRYGRPRSRTIPASEKAPSVKHFPEAGKSHVRASEEVTERVRVVYAILGTKTSRRYTTYYD